MLGSNNISTKWLGLKNIVVTTIVANIDVKSPTLILKGMLAGQSGLGRCGFLRVRPHIARVCIHKKGRTSVAPFGWLAMGKRHESTNGAVQLINSDKITRAGDGIRGLSRGTVAGFAMHATKMAGKTQRILHIAEALGNLVEAGTSPFLDLVERNMTKMTVQQKQGWLVRRKLK